MRGGAAAGASGRGSPAVAAAGEGELHGSAVGRASARLGGFDGTGRREGAEEVLEGLLQLGRRRQREVALLPSARDGIRFGRFGPDLTG